VSDASEDRYRVSISGDVACPSASHASLEERHIWAAMKPSRRFHFERVWDISWRSTFPRARRIDANPVTWNSNFDRNHGSAGMLVRGVGSAALRGARQAACGFAASGDGRLAARGGLP
jgi:hypothetical protein